jgi:hypothetical protein
MESTTGGVTFFPDLLVPPNTNVQFGLSPTRTIMQTGGTANGGQVTFPPAVLTRLAPGAPVPIAVFTTNPAVFQVATSVDYAWPAATATFAPGGAPGPAVLGTALAGGVITYSGGAKSFGGPAQFAFTPGPGAGTDRVPPNTMGVKPIASVWINFKGAFPSQASQVALVGAQNTIGIAQPGAPVASPAVTTMFGPGEVRLINVTTPVTCCTGGPFGTIQSSLGVGAAFPSNMVTASKGFPWTTGFVTISQPGAVPPEIFFLSGTDRRVAGIGNLSLVSGSLSVRALSGPNANRGWLTLRLVTPEPSAVLAAGGALAMLGVCHGLMRRRRSR